MGAQDPRAVRGSRCLYTQTTSCGHVGSIAGCGEHQHPQGNPGAQSALYGRPFTGAVRCLVQGLSSQVVAIPNGIGGDNERVALADGIWRHRFVGFCHGREARFRWREPHSLGSRIVPFPGAFEDLWDPNLVVPLLEATFVMIWLWRRPR